MRRETSEIEESIEEKPTMLRLIGNRTLEEMRECPVPDVAHKITQKVRRTRRALRIVSETTRRLLIHINLSEEPADESLSGKASRDTHQAKLGN